MRRIDLLCAILAPIAVGQLIEFSSMLIGALFIAGWNVVSFILEYIIFVKVYVKVPRLAIKLKSTDGEQSTNTDEANQKENGN